LILLNKRYWAAGLNKIRRLYARERTAARLMEYREKAVLELGCLAHRKIASGQLVDPELASASQAVDGWDRMLGRMLEQEGTEAGSARLATAVGPEASSRPNDKGMAAVPPDIGSGATEASRVGIQSILQKGLFGALLSVMLTLALCLALSTVANSALNQAVTSGKASVADKVQGKLEAVKPDRLNGKPGEQAAEKVRGLLEDKWSAFARFQGDSDFKIVDVPTTYLLAHNVKSAAQIRLGNNLISSDMQFQIGLYAWLLVPLLAFLVGGYVAARRMRMITVRQAVWLALVIGAANALLSWLLAQLSGFSAAMELPRGIGSAAIDFGFSPASGLLNGFALGTVFSLTGALLRLGGFKWAKLMRDGTLPYGEPIRLAAATIVRGVCLCLIYALVLLWAKGALTTVLALLLPQLAIYLWGIANGNLFHMTNFIAGQGKQVEVSVFGGIQGAGMEGATAEWHLYLLLSALLPVALLLFAGMRMKPKSGDPHRQTMLFSAVYALLMSLLTMLTRIGMTVRGQAAFIDVKSFTLEAGFSTLATFATCFIVAYVCVMLGVKAGARQRLRRRASISG